MNICTTHTSLEPKHNGALLQSNKNTDTPTQADTTTTCPVPCHTKAHTHTHTHIHLTLPHMQPPLLTHTSSSASPLCTAVQEWSGCSCCIVALPKSHSLISPFLLIRMLDGFTSDNRKAMLHSSLVQATKSEIP